jgi:NADPH:quinone reductase-like Zn-dependent oxidoreductase
MRALQLTEIGASPTLVDIDPPQRGEGEVLIEVAAVALNPVDITVASGRFFGGTPPLPYVPGCEAVGRVREGGSRAPGARVWLQGGGLGIARSGTLTELVSVPEAVLADVPDGVSDELACSLGIAGIAGWIPVSWRLPVRAGDRVLVLGATSNVGLVAIQAAALRGAARIVGAGRRTEGLRRARELGAHATVELGAVENLAGAFVDAFDGERPSYIFDALWGAPLVAALEASAPGVRVLHMGQSASPEATIPSNFVRGRNAELVGYSNLFVPAETVRDEYGKLLAAAAGGQVQLDVVAFPFEQAPEAWARQVQGPGAKLVVTR